MNKFPLFLYGLPHLLYFGVSLPYRTWLNRNDWPARDGSRTRVEIYRRQISHFGSCALLSLATMAMLMSIPSRPPQPSSIFVLGRDVERLREVWFGLLSVHWPTTSDLAMGLLAFVVMITIDLAYSRRCFDRGAPHMFAATPQTSQERLGWIGLSAAAGIQEELTWRAVQPELIAQATGHLWPAVVICAATFGMGHIRQGRAFVLIAGFFALIFHALTWLTGSIYIPMVVHVAVNVTVGLRAGTWKPRG